MAARNFTAWSRRCGRKSTHAEIRSLTAIGARFLVRLGQAAAAGFPLSSNGARTKGLNMNWRRAIAVVSTLAVLSTDALAKDLPIWMPPDARAAAASESGAY